MSIGILLLSLDGKIAPVSPLIPLDLHLLTNFRIIVFFLESCSKYFLIASSKSSIFSLRDFSSSNAFEIVSVFFEIVVL